MPTTSFATVRLPAPGRTRRTRCWPWRRRRSRRNTGNTRNSPAATAAGSIPIAARSPRGERAMTLSSGDANYLGLALKNPLVASASPLNSEARQSPPAGGRRRRRDRAAVAVPGADRGRGGAHGGLMDAYAESSPEAQSYFPACDQRSLRHGSGPLSGSGAPRREAVAIPIIASLNGSSRAGWIEYATLIEQAGAAALELNMYHVPTDLLESGRDIEARYIEIVGPSAARSACRSRSS